MTYDELVLASEVNMDVAEEVLRNATSEQLKHYLTTVRDDGSLTGIAREALELREITG